LHVKIPQLHEKLADAHTQTTVLLLLLLLSLFRATTCKS
jgi:hypothetical protein